MKEVVRFRRADAIALLLLTVAGGCSKPQLSQDSMGGGGSGARGPDPVRGGGIALADAAVDAPGSGADACLPITCTPVGGRYCGKIGDGCGQDLDCGGCPVGETCGGGGTRNTCGRPAPAACTAIECVQPGGRICGRVGDGCGRAINCGDCPAGESCGPNRVCMSGQCDNLCPRQAVCPAGRETTLTGTVFAPTPPRFGPADPLYNAVVYVPNGKVAPFAPGAACEKCQAQVSGAPLVSAVTGPDGKFVLRNVPTGTAIPLVIQIGRWRRQVVVDRVEPCTTVALPAELTRLPRNQREGDIPQFAIATGALDAIECLLRKIGIDDSEFTLPSGSGRVHMYRHFGSELAGGTVPGIMLTGNPSTINRYDMVLLPCDSRMIKPAAAVANLVQFTERGGRLFLTDWSDTWLRDAPGFAPLVSWLPEASHLGNDYLASVDQSFPKGRAFAEWLRVVGASPGAGGPAGMMGQTGQVPIQDIFEGGALAAAVQSPAQRWLYTDSPRQTVQSFTFNTPVSVPPARQCGRVIYSNFHVMPDPAAASPVFPGFCQVSAMTPQEKALEFMLFDAAACVQPDTEQPKVFEPPPLPPPEPPPVID